jgi:hypothetical protein
MSPKEKAKELVDKFIEHTMDWDILDGYVDDMIRAKQCALIAVHEILQITARDNYWRNVKQEIEKL